MTKDDRRMLGDILVVKVLFLAAHLKAAKERRGVTSTCDYTREAAALIKQKRESVLTLLRSEQ